MAHQEQALAGHLTRALAARRAAPGALALRRALRPDDARRLHDLLRAATRCRAADMAVVVTGVNDVIDQVPSHRAAAHRAALADWLLGARGVAHVLFAPLPPVHRFPLLPQPLRRVMGATRGATTTRWRAGRRRAATCRTCRSTST